MATLLLMCDRRDLGTAVGERLASAATEINWEDFAKGPATESEAKEFFEPNLYIYDAYPGGIGFSEPLYRACETLLNRTLELISACPCENGCPSCVGPTADRSERTKEVALEILARVSGDTQFAVTQTDGNGMSMRYVSLKRVYSEPCRAQHKQESGAYLPLLDDAGESLSPMRKVQPDPERSGSNSRGHAEEEPMTTENIFQCAAGALTPPRYSPDTVPSDCSRQMAPESIADPEQWLFSIRKLPVSPVAVARMHFSLALHGGKAADLKLSSSSCASTARNARCCSLCENE